MASAIARPRPSSKDFLATDGAQIRAENYLVFHLCSVYGQIIFAFCDTFDAMHKHETASFFQRLEKGMKESIAYSRGE